MNPKLAKHTRRSRLRKLSSARHPGEVTPAEGAHDSSDPAGTPRSGKRTGNQDRRHHPGADPSYAVGFGRPPKQTQFKPGISGNPKGRAPQSRNLKTIVTQVLDEPTPIRKGSRRRHMAAIEALVRMTLARAFQGDLKALAALHGFIRYSGYGAERAESGPDFLQGVDLKAILEEFLGRATSGDSTMADNDPAEDSDPSKKGKV